MSLYDELREKYSIFKYNSYEVSCENNEILVRYHFEIEGLSEFAPTWRFDLAGHDFNELMGNKTFLELVFNLGMVELVSYWKIACPKQVQVLCGKLTTDQIAWWKDLYFHGLGEFFYTIGIPLDSEGFMEIVSMGDEQAGEVRPLLDADGCMVPIGGGKDSVVSVELLRSAGEDAKCYIINPRGATINTTKAGKFADEDVIVAKERWISV